jgi:fructoselysine 6-kinase
MLPNAAPVRAWLASRGVLVSQDCGVTSGYTNLDIAFCSQAATGGPASAIAQAAVAGGARLAVVTRGADGSMAHDGRTWWHADAVPVEAVDTTGAGDSYAAAFLDAWISGADVDQAMAAGSAAAARTCSHHGGWPQDGLAGQRPT